MYWLPIIAVFSCLNRDEKYCLPSPQIWTHKQKFPATPLERLQEFAVEKMTTSLSDPQNPEKTRRPKEVGAK